MKKLIVFILVFFVYSFAAENSLTTFVQDNTGGLDCYTFTGTNTAAQNYFVVAPSQGYFNSDDQSDVITLRFSSGEATADSIRWTTTYQVRVRSTDSWATVATFADTNSTSAFLHVLNPLTYGKWPQSRFVVTGAAAKNALQTLTGQVTFDKD